MNKKTLSKLLFITALLLLHAMPLLASQPDTIRVTSHERTVIVTDPSQGINLYPAWAVFPDKDFSIRKITMFVRFACPDTMRCADWDYSDRILLGRQGGLTGETLNYEIGRIITPYGGFFQPQWNFTWETDVTDFSLILRDSIEVVFIHSGYEPNHDRGWMIDVSFEIITGPPSAVPLSIAEIYNDHFPYGDTGKPADELISPVEFTANQNAAFARLRVIQTGHGMDKPDNCAEFCNKYREIWYDGELFDKRQLWMECGDNPVFPQAGTWIFDRGNWCPGHLMQAETHELNVTPDKTHTIRFRMEPYTATETNNGAQVISAYLIQYGEPIFTNDVAVTDIISPTNKDIHSRKNPRGANGQITLKNHGSAEVTSVDIQYGAKGFPVKHHRWEGSLLFNQSQTVTLPGIIESNSGHNLFSVTLSGPNGETDQYPADNTMASTFFPAPAHPTELVFYLLTNHQPEQNAWRLIDYMGNVVSERVLGSLAPNSVFRDTLHLEYGAYTLTLTDTGGDGLEFWWNTKGGRGEARLLDGNNNLLKSFESDCGSGWSYHFTVGPEPDEIDPDGRAISLYPTRTSDVTNLGWLANTPADVLVRVVADPGGEVVEEHRYTNLKEGNFTYDLRRYPYGRFFLKVTADGKEVFNKRIRFAAPAPEHEEPPYMLPADPAVHAKLNEWQDWKFGVIIHWGPYSQWGVVESWSLCPEDEPWCERKGPFADDYYTYVTEYENIRKSFNPEKFNPERWANACSKAGMKYVVFTTKHHDGFCMYNTRFTDYKITDQNSLFSGNAKSNIAKEVFSAFRAKGMAAGVYFSKPDWHSDDYWWPYFPVTDRNVNYDPEKYPDRWKRFQEFTFHQIEELMTDYGDIDILWLDGGWVRPAGTLTEETRPWLGKNQWVQDINMPDIAGMARSLQPGLLIVDRTVHGEFENYRTPEQQIPDKTPPYPWESCITLGDSWYSTGPNERYKSTAWAIHTLIKIVAKGGNFLLGIGPDKTGELVPEVYARLEEIGKWMDVNGQAIYNTTPLAPYQEGNVCFTRSKEGETRYALYLNTGDAALHGLTIELPAGFVGDKSKIGLLGFPNELSVQSNNRGITVTLPDKLPVDLAGSPALVFFVQL